MKIIIAGGSGFLGKVLSSHFVKKGYQVVVLTRQHQLDTEKVRYEKWDGRSLGPWARQLEGADALINLTGKSVDCRYTEPNKQLIYDSRIDATNVLGQAIERLSAPPPIWINASSATIYRHSLEKAMDEASGELGKGFSVDVCKKWERTFFESKTEIRKVALRIAIVLGKEDGALKPLKDLARIGMGGKQGNGNQFFSWIHEEDFCNVVDFVIHDESLEGVLNVAAPAPITNKSIMKAIRRSIGVPFGFPLPKWILEIGALLIKTETELILKSRRVVPKRLLDLGFTFRYPEVHLALQDLIHK